jgi:two-component system cell cycle response regulator
MIEHQIILSRLLDDGYTDKTTGCHTRQYLLEVLEPQIEASRMFNFPLSVALIEIAHFRQIRFTFGDKIADKILAETAKTIKSRVRSSDLLVRFGSESFALLLLHANRLGAEIVCKRVRDLIAHHPFDGRDSSLVLAANFGAADQLPEFDCAGKELLSRAELALEKASRSGGGAIIVNGINL